MLIIAQEFPRVKKPTFNLPKQNIIVTGQGAPIYGTTFSIDAGGNRAAINNICGCSNVGGNGAASPTWIGATKTVYGTQWVGVSADLSSAYDSLVIVCIKY